MPALFNIIEQAIKLGCGKRFCALSARKPRKPNGPEAPRAGAWPELSVGLHCSRPARIAESGTSALARPGSREAA